MKNPLPSVDKSDNQYIEKHISKIEDKVKHAFTDLKPDSLYKPSEYFLKAGGKRIRPLLVVLSCGAVKGKVKNAYNAAAAVELLHNFTLVHDDIMDNADKRRGRDTMHIKYDVNTAILSGDGMLAIAYKSLLKDCKNNALSIMEAFTQGLVEVCEGQSYDKDYELKSKVSIEDYYIMIRKKTAAMLEMCCTIGALIGNGSKKEIKALANFGLDIGLAFQIQDDLLDVFGTNEFGKKTGGDLVEGKKTFLFLKALEVAKGKDKEKLLIVIKNKGINPDQVDDYKELYKKLGVLEIATKAVSEFNKKAIKSLNILDDSLEKRLLLQIANSLINRSK